MKREWTVQKNIFMKTIKNLGLFDLRSGQQLKYYEKCIKKEKICNNVPVIRNDFNLIF